MGIRVVFSGSSAKIASKNFPIIVRKRGPKLGLSEGSSLEEMKLKWLFGVIGG